MEECFPESCVEERRIVSSISNPIVEISRLIALIKFRTASTGLLATSVIKYVSLAGMKHPQQALHLCPSLDQQCQRINQNAKGTQMGGQEAEFVMTVGANARGSGAAERPGYIGAVYGEGSHDPFWCKQLGFTLQIATFTKW
ncbi:hypothetical protein CsSME_00016304 [Camellia sinensis var. sinensis]